MTINFCDLCGDPCTGKNAWIGNNNSQETWRTLVAQALCALSTGSTAGLSPANWESGEIAFGDAEITYEVLIANAESAKVIDIYNGYNVGIWISFNGTDDQVYLPPTTGKIYNLKDMGMTVNTDVEMRAVSAPASGSVIATLGY